MALSKIDVANMVTGITPVANGGTGLASGTTDQYLKFTGTTTIASAAVSSGLSGAQTFRTTGDTQVTSGSDTLIANWEAIDEPAGQGVIGSSVSHSSGTFTITATGIWQVSGEGSFKMSTTNRYFGMNLQYTTDAWSSTQSAANPSGSAYRDSGTYYQDGGVVVQLIDVTDTSNFQVRFNGSCEQTNGAYVLGSSASTYTWCKFLRLGDT
tara:strand:- start:33 stop:662 length:630 start_codon:yes stop_codon:yes gene_type:complete